MNQFFLSLIFLTSCNAEPKGSPIPHETSVNALRFVQTIGPEASSILRYPDKVEGISLEKNAVAFSLSAAQIKQFQELLFNDAHYLFDLRKKMLFIPTYEFHFFQGSAKMIVVVSLPSQQLQLTINGSSFLLDDDPAGDKFNAFINSIK